MMSRRPCDSVHINNFIRTKFHSVNYQTLSTEQKRSWRSKLAKELNEMQQKDESNYNAAHFVWTSDAVKTKLYNLKIRMHATESGASSFVPSQSRISRAAAETRAAAGNHVSIQMAIPPNISCNLHASVATVSSSSDPPVTKCLTEVAAVHSEDEKEESDIPTFFSGMQATFLNQAAVFRKSANHNVSYGLMVEEYFRGMLQRNIPAVSRVHSGEIIRYGRANCTSRASRLQLDCVVYSTEIPLLQPAPDTPCLFFEEGVQCIVEIKCTLTTAEFDVSRRAAATLFANYSSSATCPPYVLVCLKSQLPLTSIKARVGAITPNFASIFVLNVGRLDMQSGEISYQHEDEQLPALGMLFFDVFRYIEAWGR